MGDVQDHDFYEFLLFHQRWLVGLPTICLAKANEEIFYRNNLMKKILRGRRHDRFVEHSSDLPMGIV